MIESLTLSTAFFLGLLGGTHCLGMCGGIAATISLNTRQGLTGSLLLLFYNSGRIISYCVAGAIVGSLGWLASSFELQLGLRSFAGIMLILMGFYVAQWWKILTLIERLGSGLWAGLSPLTKRLLPVKRVDQALLLGVLWGWLPCGLVYSTLLWASAAGNVQQSTTLMLMFGIGTLPVMLLTGVLAQQVKGLLQHKITQQLAGGLIIFFGLYTIPWNGLLSLFQVQH